jgi:hypothetical protein
MHSDSTEELKMERRFAKNITFLAVVLCMFPSAVPVGLACAPTTTDTIMPDRAPDFMAVRMAGVIDPENESVWHAHSLPRAAQARVASRIPQSPQAVAANEGLAANACGPPQELRQASRGEGSYTPYFL